MGPVSIGVEVQRNTDGDTPSTSDLVGNPKDRFCHDTAHSKTSSFFPAEGYLVIPEMIIHLLTINFHRTHGAGKVSSSAPVFYNHGSSTYVVGSGIARLRCRAITMITFDCCPQYGGSAGLLIFLFYPSGIFYYVGWGYELGYDNQSTDQGTEK